MIWQKAWSTKFPSAPTHSYPTLASWIIKRLNNRITGRWTDIASGRFDLEWKVIYSVYQDLKVSSKLSKNCFKKFRGFAALWIMLYTVYKAYIQLFIILKQHNIYTLYLMVYMLIGHLESISRQVITWLLCHYNPSRLHIISNHRLS